MRLSFKKVFGIVVAATVVLVVGSVATLWILYPPEKIKAMIIPQVEKALSRKVSVDKVGISIFPVLGVSLSGVEISNSNRDGFSSDPFVKLDRFLIQIGITSIFKGYPEISKIVLKRPQILVEVDIAGGANYDDMAIMTKDTTEKEKKSSALPVLPVPISLKSFIIEQGSFIYRDKKSKQEFNIGSIDQKISFDIDKGLKDIKTSGNLILSQISVKTKDIKKPLSNISVTLSHAVNADLVNGNATISQLRLSFQKVFLNLTGTVTDLNTEPNLDLVLNSDPIQIKDLMEEIPAELVPDLEKMAASGLADLNLNIKGVLKKDGALPIKGNLKLKDVMVKYISLPKSINNLNADCDFTDTSVSINKMNLKFGDNPIELHASFVNFKHPFVDLAILAKLKLDDVKDLMELPKGASLGGNVVIDVNAKGEVDAADPTKLDVKGNLDCVDMKVSWPPLAMPALVNGQFTLSSKAIGQNVSVKIGQSSLTMTAAVTNYLSLVFADSTKKLPRPSVDFTFTSPMLNVDEFMPPSKDTNSVKNASPKTASSPQQDVPLIVPLPGVDLKGTVSSKKIIYQGIEMNDLSMRVNVLGDVANIDMKTGFASGSIGDVIHADLRNVSNISFNNKLTINNVQVNDLIGRFGGFIKPSNALNRELITLQNSLFGKVFLTSDISGQGGTQEAITKSLKGDITAKIGEGKIVNSKILNNLAGKVEKFVKISDLEFRDLKAVMHIENEQVQFNSFQIFSNLGDWDANGTTGFNGDLHLDVNNKLTKETSGKLLSVQNKGKDFANGLLKGTKFAGLASSVVDNVGIPSDKEGRITLKMDLDGTLSNPQASFSGFGEGESKSATASEPSPKKQLVEQVKQDISEKKEELEKNLQAQKAKAEQDASLKIAAEKAALEAQAKQKEEELKKNAVGKLKKFF